MKKESSQRVTEILPDKADMQCVYRETSFLLGTGMHLICTILIQVVTDLMSLTLFLTFW